MSDQADTSLILGSGQQLSLMPDEALDAVGLPPSAYADAEARGRFTGERIFSTNPKLYRAITKLLARGETYREIAELCEVSTQTVMGVAWREGVPIETLRERLGRLAIDVARLSLEAMLDLLSDPVLRAKIGAKDLAVMFGIATTNSQLLLGGATARVETREITEPGHGDYLRILAAAQAAARRGEINVTPSATGLGARNLAPKEALAAQAASGAEPVQGDGVASVVTPPPAPSE